MVRSEPRYNFVRPSDVFEQVVFSLIGDAMRLPRTVFRWAVSFPALSLPILGCGAVAHQWGASTATAAIVLTVLLAIAWRLAWPGSFRRCVSGRILVRWRGWSRYERHWPQICALHGLANTLDQDVLVPQLKRIVIGTGVDVLTVRMLPGQSTTDWQKQAEALAHALGAQVVRVRSPRPGWVELEAQ
ncbi:hypothetical protein [Nocardioides pocheonensis]|uniref:Cell division protein FtsK n=1 Tax=Nocardioides pocheonensis TaxID=661485 RepID=A0A3N0GLF4_9ACTN|nr:hypothetical protein [Nocardioides pocheonensis]RNM13006.1 hypothetical protein EFL26_16370 [Nocardioides pocheonensis]